MSFDAIVVGAGPAGSAAAMSMGRAGLKVLLAEGAMFPRPKACGDALNRRALRALENLRIDTGAFPCVEAVRVTETASRAIYENSYERNHARIITRTVLDNRLAAEAASSGVELRTGFVAEGLEVQQGRIVGGRFRDNTGKVHTAHAPVTIVATGASSRLRSSHLTGFAIRRYFSNVNFDGPAAFEISLPLELTGLPIAGYAWVFPMGEGRANVGVGCARQAGGPFRLPLLLSEFENQLVVADPRFRTARRDGRALGAPLAAGGHGRRVQARGVLYVGDAAGLTNPYLGDGIGQALESGMAAAQVAISHLDGSSPLNLYPSRLAGLELTKFAIAPGLPAIYRNLARVSRDIVPFLSSRSTIAKAAWSLCEGRELRDRRRHAGEAGKSLQRAASEAADRAQREACRPRPVLNDLLRHLKNQAIPGAPAAGALLEAWAAGATRESPPRNVQIAATCIEMTCLVAWLFDDAELPLDDASSGQARGGGWLEASLKLTMGDAILARCFSLSSRLSDPTGLITRAAIQEILQQLTENALRSKSPSATRRLAIVVSAAAKAGALMQGKTDEEAKRISTLAAEVGGTQSPRLFHEAFASQIRHSKR